MKILVCILTKKRFEENTKYAIEKLSGIKFAKLLVLSIEGELEIQSNNQLQVESKIDFTIAQAKRYALEYANENNIQYVCFYPLNTLTEESGSWISKLLFSHINHFSSGVVGVLNQDTDYDCEYYTTNDYESSLINVAQGNIVEGLYILNTKKALELNCFSEDFKGYNDYHISKLFQLYGYHNFYCVDVFCFKYSVVDDVLPNKDAESFERCKNDLNEKVKNISK